MKKRQKLWIYALMFCLMLAVTGCKGDKNTTNEADDNLSANTVEDRKLSKDWIRDAHEYYLANCDFENGPVVTYGENIPGKFYFYATDLKGILMTYLVEHSGRQNDTIQISVNQETETANVMIDIYYEDDSRFYASVSSVPVDGIEDLIRDITNEDSYEFCKYPSGNIDAHDVRGDLDILYARFIQTSDIAFEQFGTPLAEYGLVLGDTFRTVDATAFMSGESETVSEHVFADGVCTDCGVSWPFYVAEQIRSISGSGYANWASYYAPDCQYTLSAADYTQFTAENGENEFFYHGYDSIEDDRRMNFYMRTSDVDCHAVAMSFTVMSVKEMNDSTDLETRCSYSLELLCKAADVKDIFSSKESLAEACVWTVSIDDNDGNTKYFENPDEEDLEGYNETKYLYADKEELCELFLDNYYYYFKCIDRGLEEMATSLSEFGIQY